MTKLVPLINDSWFFYKKHCYALFALLIPFVIPLSIASSAIETIAGEEWYPEYISWVFLILGLVLYPIYQGAIILYIASALTGDYLKKSEYYQRSLEFWYPLFALYIITGIAIIAGLFLLIIPGLIVLSRVSFSEFFCLFDKMNATESFSTSWERTEDVQWLLLRGILILSFAIYAPFLIFEYLMSSIEIWNPVFSFISGAALSLLAPLVTIFLFRVFTLERERLNK